MPSSIDSETKKFGEIRLKGSTDISFGEPKDENNVLAQYGIHTPQSIQ